MGKGRWLDTQEYFYTFEPEMYYLDGDVKQAAGYTWLLLHRKKLLIIVY